MSRYSYDFKLEVVQAYLSGRGGYRAIANEYGLADKSQVRQWVRIFELNGEDGLKKSEKNQNYSFDFKLSVVECYLTTETSYSELARTNKMNNPSLICRWVQEFHKYGLDGLREKPKGRVKKMPKVPIQSPESKKTSSKSKGNLSQEDYIKELEKKLSCFEERMAKTEQELLYTKIENDFLKELRKLRLSQENIKNHDKARIIHSFRGTYQLKDILVALNFNKSNYEYHKNTFNKENPDEELENNILELRKIHKDFGYRRILSELKKLGFNVNKKKVQRIIQKLGLQVKSFTRKSRKYSSYKGNVGKVAKNLLRRHFITTIPHQKISTDTTEFKYYTFDKNMRIVQKKLYLDPFMDMFNSEIISYSISHRPSAEGIQTALEKAIAVTEDCEFRRTFHSDQGWAYQMKSYSKRLKASKIFQSMSRKGNCHDNSVMENFFGLLKQEIYYGNTFYSYEELQTAIENWIEYYNTKRTKAKLGYLSPVEFRVQNQLQKEIA